MLGFEIAYSPPPSPDIPASLPGPPRRTPATALGGLFRCRLDSRLPCKGVVGDDQVNRLKPLNLVPQPRRFFEFEVLGSFAHVFAHAFQNLLEVAAMQRFIDLRRHAAHIGVALIETRQDIIDVFLYRFGGYAVFDIISHLFFAASICFGDGTLHRTGHPIRVHDGSTVYIASSAPDCLDERVPGSRTKT